ncbi:GFA family protein [Neisseria shayeganii]|uniref:CENP-V/GFA domain-containing protein n=1 Tax=Neisseria shayeganii TaxID=607712 RepID=A0A7D7S793_9NEIS|nr:DUF6151 family protein [Neisseria shayeganii]QMT40068.1 hypothetical protein H3L94_09450 [Neisseria shayeganii]
MTPFTPLACRCGQTRIEVVGAPFMVTECLCNSCRAAAGRLAALPQAQNLLTPLGATATALYRKDRVRFVEGFDRLAEFRLTDDSGTRRVVATCCNTPMFMELKGAHWLDIYLHLWPAASRPKPQMRTMASDLADASALPDDLPNLPKQSLGFYAKLLGAWIGMGFKNPPIAIKEKLHA